MLKKVLTLSVATICLMSNPALAAAEDNKNTQNPWAIKTATALDAKKCTEKSLSVYNADSKTCLKLSGNAKINHKFSGDLGKLNEADFKPELPGDANIKLESSSALAWGTVTGTLALGSSWDNMKAKEIALKEGKVSFDTNVGKFSFGYFGSAYSSLIPYATTAHSPNYDYGIKTSHLEYMVTLNNGFKAVVSLERQTKPVIDLDSKDNKDKYKIAKNTHTVKGFTGKDTLDPFIGKLPILVVGAEMPFELSKSSALSKVTVAAVTSFNPNMYRATLRAKVATEFSNGLTTWVQGGYKNGGEVYHHVDKKGKAINVDFENGFIARTSVEPYGDWNGAIYGAVGASYKFSEKFSADLFAGMDAGKDMLVAVSAEYKFHKGFSLSGGVAYLRNGDSTIAAYEDGKKQNHNLKVYNVGQNNLKYSVSFGYKF
ncbi:porin [Bartonella sp. DGB1]|uniref:porin n=1 Tax=Bartonella sp. DGB1 TaxID=3239807 RepID=UPI00352588ED